MFLYIALATSIGYAAAAAPAPYSDETLSSMAGNKYADGELPLGDGHYTLDAPRKGYIYLCHPMQGRGGAGKDGPWIHGKTWNILQKAPVQGKVTWPAARFSNNVDGERRVLSGNDLPSHATGQFPISASDPAFVYDRNPNAISPQNLYDALPLDPSYSDTPYCMGGEAGVMLTGVYLFNGFDAGMRDAAAHEVQDSCNGHPQVSGQYHYHSLSACINDIGIKTVIGYALDGFPITGPMVEKGKYLTTDDLDVCHGLVSEIVEGGVKKTTYHYVMTQDFPYSVSCFRARPSRTKTSDQGMAPHHGMSNPRQPPPEAISACAGRDRQAPCRFTSPRGDVVQGYCDVPATNGFACRPADRP